MPFSCLTSLTMGIRSFVKQVNLDMYPKSACFVQANLILMKFFCLLHIFECDACWNTSKLWAYNLTIILRRNMKIVLPFQRTHTPHLTHTLESAVWSGTLSSSQVMIFNKSWIILAQKFLNPWCAIRMGLPGWEWSTSFSQGENSPEVPSGQPWSREVKSKSGILFLTPWNHVIPPHSHERGISCMLTSPTQWPCSWFPPEPLQGDEPAGSTSKNSLRVRQWGRVNTNT